MPLGLSFDTDEDQELNPLAPKAPGPQAVQNPLANMAGAASPGLTSPFESAFGPMNGLSTDKASTPGGTATRPSAASPTTENPLDRASQPGAAPTTLPPGGGNKADFMDPWATFSGDAPQPATPQPAAPGGNRSDYAGQMGAPQQPDVAAKGPEVSVSQPSTGGADKSAEMTARFKDMSAQLASATDPQQRALLQDKLSRDIFGSLSDAGHNVKWDGDQLVVDGRKYVVGGPTAAATAGGTAAGSGQTWSPGAKAGQNVTLLGFESNKLMDPNSGSVPGSKYTPAAKAFYQGLKQDVGLSRGGLDNMVNYLKANGFPNATSDRRQKIDFGDGEGLIDVIRSDGQIVFQNTTGNPTWEGRGYQGGDPGHADGGPDIFDDVMTPRAGGAADVDTRVQPTPSGPMTIPPPAAPAAAPAAPGPTAAPYTPGTIDDSDLAGLSLDDILARIGSTPTPGALDTNYQAGQIESDYQTGQISNDPLSLGRVGNYEQGSITNDPLDTYGFDGQFKGDVGDNLGTLGAGQTDTETERLVLDVLQNPESYPPHIVEMLKAQSKDELAQMQNQEDEDLTAAGFRTGNADSNWLASEKLASAGRRDQALVGSNRTIDLTAAEKNMADKRAAAGLGNEFANSRSSRLLAERGQRFTEAATGEGLEQAEVDSKNNASQFDREGQRINEDLRGDAYDKNAAATTTNAGLTEREAAFRRAGEVTNQDLRNQGFQNRTGAQTTNEQLRGDAADRNLKASQANIDNQFKSAAERRAAVALASDTTLAAAAQKGDRRALEQAFKQKATELGQSADRIRQDYILATIHDATTRRGQDIGDATQRRGQDVSSETSRFMAELGASVDRAKLAQAGSEFQMDLIFRLKALQQADRQFGASLGLDTAKASHAIDQDHFKRIFPD